MDVFEEYSYLYKDDEEDHGHVYVSILIFAILFLLVKDISMNTTKSGYVYFKIFIISNDVIFIRL